MSNSADESSFETWRDQFTLNLLMLCSLEKDQIQKFWNLVRSLELLKTVCWENQKTVQSRHNSLKLVSRRLFRLRDLYLSPSLGLHLLRPSQLEEHFDLQSRKLQSGIELLETCANELENCRNLITTLHTQMKHRLVVLVMVFWKYCYHQHPSTTLPRKKKLMKTLAKFAALSMDQWIILIFRGLVAVPKAANIGFI